MLLPYIFSVWEGAHLIFYLFFFRRFFFLHRFAHVIIAGSCMSNKNIHKNCNAILVLLLLVDFFYSLSLVGWTGPRFVGGSFALYFVKCGLRHMTTVLNKANKWTHHYTIYLGCSHNSVAFFSLSQIGASLSFVFIIIFNKILFSLFFTPHSHNCFTCYNFHCCIQLIY